ncbi:MAG TPA: M23 family metallopeptidase [Solirubrobacterales bacterium]|nr:M23 family metallopeptidase [Solirubrobacterales bacterium]
MTLRGGTVATLVSVAALLVLAAPVPAAQFGSRPLKMGSKGKDVRVLQRSLTRLGQSTPVTGYFWKLTKRSTKGLERAQRWRVDGKVSRKDAARIAALAAPAPMAPTTTTGTVYFVRGLVKPEITLTAQAPGSAAVDVVDVATGAAVARLTVSFESAGTADLRWNGLTASGGIAPDGSYRFDLAEPGDAQAAIIGGQTDEFRLRRHAFPVPGQHDYGGVGSRFGAPRSGHTHQGQDMAAACGEPLLATETGTVAAKAYQAGGAGHYLVIQGAVTGTAHVYMHMVKASWADKGQAIFAGQQLGKVGSTGSSTGCHLHFERWTAPGWYVGGKPYDPLKELRYWDSYS